MGGYNTWEDKIEMARSCYENRTKDRWRLLVRVIVGALFVTCALTPAVGYPQSLDEAVRRQLAADIVSRIPCSELLGGDDTDVLTGALKSICDRQVDSTVLSSAASGGGTGTPTTLPGVVQERLAEARNEDKTESGEARAVELAKGLNFFISGEYEELDRKATTLEEGYDSDIQRLTAGVDFQITEQLIAGFAVNAADQNGDFLGSGNFEVESYGVVVFGLLQPTQKSFVQAYGGYTSMSNDRKRFAEFTEEYTQRLTTPQGFYSASGVPKADFDTDQYSAGILAGCDHSFGGLTLGPRIGLDWMHTNFDTYSENGADSGFELTFYDDEVTSLQSGIGLWGSVATSTDFGVITMQQSLFWKHEFDQDQRDIEVSFVDDLRAKRFTFETEEPDRDFFEYNVGLSVILPNGVQGYANFRTLLGHSYFDSYAGTIGMRIKL